ncbi:MAG: hypothetical protein LAP61_09995 [Acidobacteriia bacterium]|nr:hypothetical protein [Terriglobia bacterium]
MALELLVPAAGGGTYCAVRIILAMRPVVATRDARAMSDAALVARFTRNWIHYGFLGHTVLCVLIAAVEGLLGR